MTTFKKKNIYAYLIILKRKYIFKKNMSKSRIKNMCIISGRSRAVFKKFKISRIILRYFANSGNFFGLKKLSW